MKDLFSAGSQLYQQARPSYPPVILEAILKHVTERQLAWDCAAGSGQFTQLLAPHFEHVVATDLSLAQLQQAPRLENVSYQVQSAEKTSFMANSFDLITVAQAIHWFDFERFYQEVKRCLKVDGVLAVIGYGLVKIAHEPLNRLIQILYGQTLSGYWDIERRYIDEAYRTIPFPFKEIEMQSFQMDYCWSGQQLLNYLNTWSALKHFRQQHSHDPLTDICVFLASFHQPIQLSFPIYLRVGRV